MHERRWVGAVTRHGRLWNFFTCCLLVCLGSSPAVLPLHLSAAEDQRKKENHDKGAERPMKAPERELRACGKLGTPIEGAADFSLFAYSHRDERGKPVTTKVMLKIPEAATLYADQAIRMEDLQADEEVYILGRAVEREVPRRREGVGTGNRGKDSQIQAAKVVVAGKGLRVNERFKDPHDTDIRWHKAIVSTSSKGLWVTYERKQYRVTLDKSATVLRRGSGDRKLLKSGRPIVVDAEVTKPPAATEEKSNTPKDAYVAREVVLLDPRFLATAYTGILPAE